MFKALQLNIHKLLFTLFLFSFITNSVAQDPDFPKKNKGVKALDSLKPPITQNLNDSIKLNSDLNKTKDTIQIDTLKKPKGALEFILTHKAEGNIYEDFKKMLTTLHNQAEINHGDLNIKAGHIIINRETNIITATGLIDSTGYVQRPVVVQGGQESTHDTIKINFKTEKAIAWGTLTLMAGLDAKIKKMKKVNDSTIYVRGIILTTSDKEKPDYYIKIDIAKMVPDKKIVGGKSQFYIKDVPTPLILPFSYFPLTKGRTSGILLPSYGSSRNQGFYLQNGGYYLALNDYFDLTLLADIYTNGSWGLNVISNYKVRYKYNGSFSFRYENLYNSIRGFDDFGQSSNYNLRWNHSQDPKSNPNARFSASVNMGSSTYFRQSLNEYNSNSFLNNTLSSSISYQKRFVGTPFNLTSSITHTQNTNTESIVMSLPSMQVSMDRIYPFAPKNGSKKGMLQNIGTTYNIKGDYRIETTDEFFLKSEMFESARSGIQQDISLSTNTKVMKYFTLSPSAGYKEVWYFDKINKQYNADLDEVVTDTIKGFNAFREYNIGASLSTTIYGDFKFKKGRLEAIRHTIRPSVSYGYRPDFSNYYDEYQASDDPEDIKEYSSFANGIYGGPSKGLSNSIGFSIANTLEAKVKSKDSTELEPKKISLLKNLNISTSYNMASDSLKWSPVGLNAGTAFFNNKMSVNLRATLDPYALDVNGRKIDKFNFDNGGSLFRLTNAGLTMNYSLSSKTFKGKGKKKETTNNNDPTNSDGIFGEDLNATNDSSANKGGDSEETKNVKLYSASMPWTLKLAYAFNYSNGQSQNEISSHSLMFSGDIELSPKWKMGFSSGYDFKNKGFTYTQFRFNRDLDSWRLSFNWVPFGPRSTYNFFIGIKSSIFSDLKYDKRQPPDRALF